MKSKTPNARFWTMNHKGNWVKLTIRPEKPVTIHSFSKHDEGCSWESETYEIDGENLILDYAGGGSDCDGRHRSGGKVICPMDQLKSRKQWDGELMLPEWKKEEEWQRDYTAESMGY